MITSPFVSYAQNGEDVVLHRALSAVVGQGRYIDVGANEPDEDSVTRAFYDRGWRGITVEPVGYYAQRQRVSRPRDYLVQAAVTDGPPGTAILHEVRDTGLSTLDDQIGTEHRKSGREVVEVEVPTLRLDDILAEAQWDGSDIHFMVVDTEGTEEQVLRSLDLRRWRPWIVVVEATRPNSTVPSFAAWEHLLFDANYQYCVFDGLSRYYVAAEHAEALRDKLRAPANELDFYVTIHQLKRRRRIDDLADILQSLTADRDEIAGRLAARDSRFRTDLEAVQAAEDQAIEDAVNWRNRATAGWQVKGIDATPDEVLHLRRNIAHAQHTMARMRATLSWRVSGPLRAVRRISLRGRNR